MSESQVYVYRKQIQFLNSILKFKSVSVKDALYKLELVEEFIIKEMNKKFEENKDENQSRN